MGRFKELVDTEERMRKFRSKYNIPPHVGVRYAAQDEWFDDRKTNKGVILMIAFIERGMTIPMGTLTRKRYDDRVRIPTRHSSPQILPTHRITTRCQPCSSNNVAPPPIYQVEEEEEVEREEEGFVNLTSLTDDYEVFNQSSPSPNGPEDMGIQRKPQRNLQELLEN